MGTNIPRRTLELTFQAPLGLPDTGVIHMLEAGRITESGTYDELVDNDGKYAELYAIQSAH